MTANCPALSSRREVVGALPDTSGPTPREPKHPQVETTLIIAVAALWGCGASLLITRAAYRLHTVVVGVSAVTCAVLAAATGARPELVVRLLRAPIGVLLATVDFTAYRLPDALTDGSWTTALLGSIAPRATRRWPPSLLISPARSSPT